MNIFNLLPFTALSLDLIFGQKMTIATFYRVMFFTDIAFWATQCTDELRLPAISAIAPRQSVRLSVFSLFDGLAIRLFDGFELLGCCVTRYVGGATELCKTVMWDMRDTARRWSKFAET